MLLSLPLLGKVGGVITQEVLLPQPKTSDVHYGEDRLGKGGGGRRESGRERRQMMGGREGGRKESKQREQYTC